VVSDAVVVEVTVVAADVVLDAEDGETKRRSGNQ